MHVTCFCESFCTYQVFSIHSLLLLVVVLPWKQLPRPPSGSSHPWHYHPDPSTEAILGDDNMPRNRQGLGDLLSVSHGQPCDCNCYQKKLRLSPVHTTDKQQTGELDEACLPSATVFLPPRPILCAYPHLIVADCISIAPLWFNRKTPWQGSLLSSPLEVTHRVRAMLFRKMSKVWSLSPSPVYPSPCSLTVLSQICFFHAEFCTAVPRRHPPPLP